MYINCRTQHALTISAFLNVILKYTELLWSFRALLRSWGKNEILGKDWIVSFLPLHWGSSTVGLLEILGMRSARVWCRTKGQILVQNLPKGHLPYLGSLLFLKGVGGRLLLSQLSWKKKWKARNVNLDKTGKGFELGTGLIDNTRTKNNDNFSLEN